MVYGLWSMVYGLWSMVYGLWSMVYGLWSMVYGLWSMWSKCLFSIRSDSDNPFRPEGKLAKEANEFVHALQVKQEHDTSEIIERTLNTSVASTSSKKSVSQLLKEHDA